MMPAGPMEPPVGIRLARSRQAMLVYSQSDFLFGWSQDGQSDDLATGDTLAGV
ncbi:MAG: hypothetical protein U0798_10260 [Gemmataceae bacterium]